MWIAKLFIASGPAFFVFVVLFVLLGGDAKAVWVILLVFFGTVADELKDIAGCVQEPRGCAARWRTVWRYMGKYKDEFLKNLPRFCFRLLSWALLAVAGIMLVRILSS
jgi:hypothetical protein